MNPLNVLGSLTLDFSDRSNTLDVTQQMEEWDFQGRCFSLLLQLLWRRSVRNRASLWVQTAATPVAPTCDMSLTDWLWVVLASEFTLLFLDIECQLIKSVFSSNWHQRMCTNQNKCADVDEREMHFQKCSPFLTLSFQICFVCFVLFSSLS